MQRFFLSLLIFASLQTAISAADTFVTFRADGTSVAAQTGKVMVDEAEYAGVKRAATRLIDDMQSACGRELQVTVGSIDKNKTIQKQYGRLLKGKTEMYLIDIHEGNITIAGSDKRGTIYGIYELSRQLGVSPWAWWADVPVIKHDSIFLTSGQYTDGEPIVRFRGIFLNDEAPCLSRWVNEKFPDTECASANPRLAHGFNHNFYEKVFELLQRLRANYLWPAMWGNAFYADDAENSRLADEMGIIMGTSHHEPMARNHQEWARHRKENGAWDYATNQKVIDDFFREGVRRAKDNEDIITIGMRGDGDAAMGGKEGHDDEFQTQDDYYIHLYEKIFRNQRQIIREETGRAPERRTQLWALYKEVQRYYDLGLTVPDDVIIMLCDDNWGNIRRVPATNAKQKQRSGGYGMYYHVDYVGAPRCSKWANVTPAAHMWEQMQLCYQYGIDRLWILNVGDLKPMEYPIQLFLDMAWNPNQFADPASIQQHTDAFCNQFAEDAGSLLTRYTTFNGRVTPEMLNARTYNIYTGEWLQVVNEYKSLEADALRQYMALPEASRSAYFQLILYPIQSMSNLYEMYYAQACGNQEKVDACFQRDSLLTVAYHLNNNGKWNHLMDQTHIGYTSWNDPARNVCPQVSGEGKDGKGQCVAGGYTSLNADQFSDTTSVEGHWLTIPNYGRTRSGVCLWPYTASTEGASISYTFELPAGQTASQVKVHIMTNSTLPFLRREGHRYTISVDGGVAVEVNYNGDLTEDNQWHMYDVVATRVIEKVIPLSINAAVPNGQHTLTIRPIEPGMVLENIVIDFGGYQPQHLFGAQADIR